MARSFICLNCKSRQAFHAGRLIIETGIWFGFPAFIVVILVICWYDASLFNFRRFVFGWIEPNLHKRKWNQSVVSGLRNGTKHSPPVFC